MSKVTDMYVDTFFELVRKKQELTTSKQKPIIY